MPYLFGGGYLRAGDRYLRAGNAPSVALGTEE
jgi:hypothetical protein